MVARDATTRWSGGLQSGQGRVSFDSSNAGEFDVSFPRRTGDPEGQTSPEELIAAAQSACYAMSLANKLEQAGTAPEALDVSAEVGLDRAEGGLAITRIELTVRGKVDGVDDAAFREAAEQAKQACPVSRALAGVGEITVDASLG
jgi:osmotically inducible protein OsmC